MLSSFAIQKITEREKARGKTPNETWGKSPNEITEYDRMVFAKMTLEKVVGDIQFMGFLFESLVERDLAVYAECMGAELMHYQDYQNREIAICGAISHSVAAFFLV